MTYAGQMFEHLRSAPHAPFSLFTDVGLSWQSILKNRRSQLRPMARSLTPKNVVQATGIDAPTFAISNTSQMGLAGASPKMRCPYAITFADDQLKICSHGA